jgi:hypothetical protein
MRRTRSACCARRGERPCCAAETRDELPPPHFRHPRNSAEPIAPGAAWEPDRRVCGCAVWSVPGPRLKNPQRSTIGPLSEGLPTSFARLEFLTRPDFPLCSERPSATTAALATWADAVGSIWGILALTQPERLAPRSSWARPVPRPSALGPSPSTGGLRPSRPARRACDACRRPSPGCRRNQPAEQPPSPTSTPSAAGSPKPHATGASLGRMRTRCSSPSSLPPSSASARPCARPSGS